MNRDNRAIGRSIHKLARRHGTPMSQESELTGLLSQVNQAEEVPASLMQVLADVLGFVDDLEAARNAPDDETLKS
ncbi:MAG: hypothetical protein Hals2KO_33120 [Halioglobus sp.]